MIKVEEWITESRNVRTVHLDMSEPCLERGGNSTVHRGVLAQYLGTNLPGKVDLCHNCGNDKCSNPKHLYWGTRKENVEDAKRHGTWVSPWDRLVEKYGYEEACRMNSRKMIGNNHGSSNKGKSKSDEHKKNISLNRKGGKPKGWRKNNASVVERDTQLT
jgi:hypothetical protein